MIYFCCDDERRRALIEDLPPGREVNGIDFLEVYDNDDPLDVQRQRRLFVHFLSSDGLGALTKDNFRIEGGERIRPVRVKSVSADPSSVPDPNLLIIEVEEPGDFSVYTLRIVPANAAPDDIDPPNGFDPILSAVDFEFKAACEGDFDCKRTPVCPHEPRRVPPIDYLAKDYASFRQLLLDRMAVLMPRWRERHAADLGVMLVELLAYVGDHLSYQQDAIATEAYLGTARRRVSVRRHALLVDYPMHDGINARVWVRVDVDRVVTLPRSDLEGPTQFLTRTMLPSGPMTDVLSRDSVAYREAIAAGVLVFEVVDAPELLELRPQHNTMRFHTWGALECCLPRGATAADLKGDLSTLLNKVVIFGEVIGPRTGNARDADPTRRHAVRVTKTTVMYDPVDDIDVTRIEWGGEDALPFPICVSSDVEEQGVIEDVSVAWGNIVLADHGRTITEVPLGPVPRANAALAIRKETGLCEEGDTPPPPARFTPLLPDRDVTFEAAYDPTLPASVSLEVPPRQIAPRSMRLVEQNSSQRPWFPRENLLNANNNDALFVVEMESDGSAYVRFGDGIAGARPPAGTMFEATYRVGNGAAGNIGGDAIASLVSDDPVAASVLRVTNPMPARGGVDRESMERVRQNAPAAFRTQERAVTEADYGTMAQRCNKDVQRAAARFRWTGSWYTVFVTVDRKGGREVDPTFAESMRRCLDRYRMAGHDLEFDLPRFVSLDVALFVCVKREYFVGEVELAVREALSTGTNMLGVRGFFHPDNFSFGQPVYLSSLVARVMSVEGVDSVEVRKFQRKGIDSNVAIVSGSLEVGPLEIVRLDNDPNFRERGMLTLDMRGGR